MTTTAEKLQSSKNQSPLFWRNYVAHCLEGGLYMGGTTIVAIDSIMPAMVYSLGGPSWLVALMPIMANLGFGWPSIFTAHYVERLSLVKPFIMINSLFQRLPYLLSALALFFFADTLPAIVLALVALGPFLSGTMGGISLGAWYALIAKVIPENRRSSAWAIRFIITSIIGIGAGGIINQVLTKHPGATGYGILHLWTFGFLMVSYGVFALIKESPAPVTHKPSMSLKESLKSIVPLLRSDTQLRDITIARMLGAGLYVMAPFLAIHALEITGRTEASLGFLVIGQMAGGILGNIIAGYLGDKKGSKVLLTSATILLIVVSISAALIHVWWGFVVIFILYGFAMFMNAVGVQTMTTDICPHDKLPTYAAIVNAAINPAMLIAAILSGIIREIPRGAFAFSVSLTTLCLCASLFFLLRVHEPRNRRTSGPAHAVPAPTSKDA